MLCRDLQSKVVVSQVSKIALDGSATDGPKIPAMDGPALDSRLLSAGKPLPRAAGDFPL